MATPLTTALLPQRVGSYQLQRLQHHEATYVALFLQQLKHKSSDIRNCLNMLHHPDSMKALIEGYGVEKWLADWKSQHELAIHDTTAQGQLIELGPHWAIRARQVWLVVTDTTTGSPHVIRVDPHLRSVHAALAWSFGLDPQDYRPVQES